MKTIVVEDTVLTFHILAVKSEIPRPAMSRRFTKKNRHRGNVMCMHCAHTINFNKIPILYNCNLNLSTKPEIQCLKSPRFCCLIDSLLHYQYGFYFSLLRRRPRHLPG